MLTFRMARRTLELEASRGRHGLPTPRDRLPPSYHAAMKYQAQQVYVPGHTRDLVSGRYISKEAFANYQSGSKVDTRT